MTDDRAISTVLDVALALVLISASMLMLFTFVGSEDTRSDPTRADQTAETFAATTLSIDYSMSEVMEYESEYNESIFESVNETSHYLDRSAHGPATGLLADAAVTNVEFWGTRWNRAGVNFERSVSGAMLGAITRLSHSARLDAIWRPYEGTGIVGKASAGQAVPPDADVNSVTFVVSSGVDDVSAELGERYEPNGEFDDAAQVIAEAVLDHLLPPEAMQRNLESTSARRDLALYRYNRMSRVMDEIHDENWTDDSLADPDWEFGYPFTPADLGTGEVNALWLNQYMIEQTLANKIAEDLQGTFDGAPTTEELTAAVSTNQVQITVRTWETNE